MQRTLSSLNRIIPINLIEREAARSHYDRNGIGRLFELQLRAAQQLVAALPSVPSGGHP